MKKIRTINNCKLCGVRKELCYSHIIPEFFYRHTNDEKNRSLAIRLEPYREYKLQKGEREYLLCKACEDHINEYETYVGKIWDKEFPPTIRFEKRPVIRGVDYKLFKLFHLSILWRASVASIPTFKDVSLGKHEEKIRSMILRNDPGDPHEYAFIPTIQYIEDRIFYNILEPVKRNDGKFTYYFFSFGGVSWLYLVSALPATKADPFGMFPFFSKDGQLLFMEEQASNNTFIMRAAEKGRKHYSLLDLRNAFKNN